MLKKIIKIVLARIKSLPSIIKLYLLKIRYPTVNIGKGFLYKSVIITPQGGIITFADHCLIKNNVEVRSYLGGKIYFGNQCYINNNCTILGYKEITVGDNVFIGPNCVICDHDHDIMNHNNFVFSEIVIDDNVWIGANVTILKGVHIGENAVISAGSVITKDIPPNTIVIQKRNNTLIKIKQTENKGINYGE